MRSGLSGYLKRRQSVQIEMSWRETASWLFMLTTGVVISATGVAAFLVPAGVAGPGVLGIATIMNYLWSTPVGLFTLIANIPIQLLGYRYLGGAKVVLGTVYYIVAFSIVVDLFIPIFEEGLTENLLIAAIFGGVFNGLGGGLVYKAGGTMGGTSTLARILQVRLGAPLSTTSLYTDTLVTVGAGLVLGWEAALASLIAVFLTGVASDYVLEGPGVICTALIVTDHTDKMEQAIEHSLQRGATKWHSEDGTTHHAHGVLLVIVSRPEAHQLREIVSRTDPEAFVVISQGQTAFGRGFKAMQG